MLEYIACASGVTNLGVHAGPEMFKTLSKIALITTPVFIASHLITENNEKIKNYCPIVKLTNLKSPTNTPSPNTKETKKE